MRLFIIVNSPRPLIFGGCCFQDIMSDTVYRVQAGSAQKTLKPMCTQISTFRSHMNISTVPRTTTPLRHIRQCQVQAQKSLKLLAEWAKQQDELTTITAMGRLQKKQRRSMVGRGRRQGWVTVPGFLPQSPRLLLVGKLAQSYTRMPRGSRREHHPGTLEERRRGAVVSVGGGIVCGCPQGRGVGRQRPARWGDRYSIRGGGEWARCHSCENRYTLGERMEGGGRGTPRHDNTGTRRDT